MKGMNDDVAFLRAIQGQPLDPLPRLIYADFLDEHGRDREAAWLRADVRLWESYPAADADDLRLVNEHRPPDGVPSLVLAKSLPDFIQTVAALFLVVGRPLRAAFASLSAAARRAGEPGPVDA